MAYEQIDKTNWTPGTHYFTEVTADNHAAWLYIITLLSLAYVIIAFIIRFVVKYGAYGNDDWTLLASTMLAIGQYITILVGLSKGLGKGLALLDAHRIAQVQRYAAAHVYLYVLAHCASKVSTGVLTQRLFDNGRTRNTYISWGLVGAAGIFGLGSILALAVDCANFFDTACPNRFMRWRIVLGLDIVTELLLILVPVLLLQDIQIKRSAKITVLTVFGVRIVDIVFACLNLETVAKELHAEDIGTALVPSLIYTQTELLCSILAASLPCLKTFMRPFDRVTEEAWRSNNAMYASDRSGDSKRATWNCEMPLADMRRNPKSPLASTSGLEKSMNLRPEAISNDITISGANRTADDLSSSWGSQERIIHTQTQWEIKWGSEDKDKHGLH